MKLIDVESSITEVALCGAAALKAIVGAKLTCSKLWIQIVACLTYIALRRSILITGDTIDIFAGCIDA